MSLRLGEATRLSCSGRNVFSDPSLVYERDPLRGLPAYLHRYGNYGVSWLAGAKGNF